MSLADDIESSIRGSGSHCTVKVVLSELPPADAADLTAALAAHRIPASAIRTALAKRSIEIGRAHV